MNEPKSISLNEKKFEANGKTYYISDKVCIDRWKEYEKLVPRLAYGTDFTTMFKQMNKAYAALNEKKFADAAVIMHNLMSGIKDAEDEKRINPALQICALVMNFDGEDTSVYDENVMNTKINDWREEGLDMVSFFAWALNSISGFRETYLEYITEQAKNLMQKEKIE